jgi:uncharacterized protein (TIGR03083 family)
MIPYMNPLKRASEEAWDSIERTISELSADDWDRPTPCTGWSVKDVLSHVGHMEGMLIHHFDQPDPPAGWMPEGAPLDQVTGLGVASRRPWPIDLVVEEIKRVAEATRQLMARPDLDWEAETATPVGPAPLHIGLEMRTTDLVIHLCDVRAAIGRPLEDGAEPAAVGVAVGRAVRLTPWAWAKRVGAGEGLRLRLDLTGTGSIQTDVVMRNGKASMVRVSDKPDGTVEGSSLAYLLAATGRHGQVASAGGLVARGEPARLLLEKFRLVG